jgi:hypothetical protein
MAAHLRGGNIDACDVAAKRFTRLARREYEMNVVGLRALEVVDHEVPAARFYGRLELLDGGQEIGEVFRPLTGTDVNSSTL